MDAMAHVVTRSLPAGAIIRPVLKHVVLFSFKESVTPAERAALLDAIRGLRAKVPSLRSLELGENVSPARAQGYTHVLLETFDDREGLAAYVSHPDHVPVVARLGEAASQRLAVDLEI